MTSGRLGCLAILVLAFSTAGSAHRLDEYLQATRIDVEMERVEVEVHLTPGAAVAQQIVDTIDLDRNGKISRNESEVYVESLVAALTLEVDGQSRLLRIGDFIMPSIEEMHLGEGVLRLRATASTPTMKSGLHRLRFANAHWPEIGVYLVNALVPADERVHITGQSRDVLQREFYLDYTVTSDRTRLSLASVLPVMLSLGTAVTLYTVVRRFGPA